MAGAHIVETSDGVQRGSAGGVAGHEEEGEEWGRGCRGEGKESMPAVDSRGFCSELGAEAGGGGLTEAAD